MKNNLKLFLLLPISVGMLSGCASYRASQLNNLPSELVCSSSANGKSDIYIAAKAYDTMDCKRYLDRDVISKGYRPIQLYINNTSDKGYIFSLNRVDLPSARSEEVAQRVHTSTVGRILAYGIPGVLFLWPLIIPAVVDGIKSSDANDALDWDFAAKTARDQMINPHSHFNKLIFVPAADFQDSFNVTLINKESNAPETFRVNLP